MKPLLLILFLFSFTSCSQQKQANATDANVTEAVEDTIIIKHEKVLNESYEVGLYSKSYFYNWVVGKDTLDFILNATEHQKDSTLHLSVHHKKPMMLATVLDHINQSLPLISKDFDLAKFSSVYFQPPVYYPDLVKEVSGEYKQKFGTKTVRYQKLNEFLLQSSLSTRLNKFLYPFTKKVKNYGIEKFQMMKTKDLAYEFAGIDLKDYPAFVIHGFGMDVQMEEIRK